MKIWEKFAIDRFEFKKLLEKYLELRLLFKEIGFSQRDLEKVSQAPPGVWRLRSQIGLLNDNLHQQIRNYGFNVGDEEFTDFILPHLKKIDEITPLDNGNNERTNSRNEDFE